MTHLVIGPGAMGCLLGIKLAAAQPVMLVGRRVLPRHQQLTSPEGATGSHPLDCRTPASLHARDLPNLSAVHLVTKAYAAEAALAQVAEHLPSDVPLVLWQNGFAVQPRLTQHWSGPTLCASTTEGAYRISDSRIVHAGHGKTWVGHLEGSYPKLASHLAATLTNVGLATRAVDDIHVRLWHKLAINAAINPVVARFGLYNGQLSTARFQPMVDGIIEEVERIMQAAAIPLPEQGLANLVWSVVAGTARNRASMLQDVLAGRPTEHDAILLPLLQVAREGDLATPCLDSFYRYFTARLPPGKA